MTFDPELLTIVPGSDEDRAVDAIVAYEMSEGPLPDKALLAILNPNEAGHMIAIGCRLDCHRRGKTDPSQLTHQEYHGWYGCRL